MLRRSWVCHLALVTFTVVEGSPEVGVRSWTGSLTCTLSATSAPAAMKLGRRLARVTGTLHDLGIACLQAAQAESATTGGER